MCASASAASLAWSLFYPWKGGGEGEGKEEELKGGERLKGAIRAGIVAMHVSRELSARQAYYLFREYMSLPIHASWYSSKSFQGRYYCITIHLRNAL